MSKRRTRPRRLLRRPDDRPRASRLGLAGYLVYWLEYRLTERFGPAYTPRWLPASLLGDAGLRREVEARTPGLLARTGPVVLYLPRGAIAFRAAPDPDRPGEHVVDLDLYPTAEQVASLPDARDVDVPDSDTVLVTGGGRAWLLDRSLFLEVFGPPEDFT